MKKTLSFVLVLALVLSSFSMAFAGTTTTAKTDVPTDVVGTAFEAPVTVLTALGVVNGYEDGTYKPSSNVTRAEFAKLIIAELGLESNAQSSKSTFTDMGGAAWADGYVGYAASLGIINGYGDGRFGPSDNVTYDQALTMIVRALGYTSACKEMNGTWPAIYVQKAKVLGITDDISGGGSVAANRGDVAIMLYNTLTCDMGYANDEGTFVTKKDKDGDPIKVATNLDAEESQDYKVITKSDADNSVVNIRQYVGAYAKVFTLTKGDHEDDIIAVSDVKSDFITGEYKAGDKVIQAADGTEYKLDDIASKGVSGTSTNLDKDWTAYEFENGDTATAGSTILNSAQDALDTADDDTIVTIAADLSGKTIKGIYSVAKWTIDTDELVDADDIADITNNKSLLGKDFTLDDNDDAIDTTSFELIGVKSLSDIKADNVVYVYTAGSDDEITRVAVGTETATGEVTAVKESDSKDSKVTVNGNVYKFAKEKLYKNGSAADFDASDIDTEDEITAYLDAYGYMYDYDLTAGGADNYAIVLEVGQGSSSIGSNHEIKLFLADGTDKVFNVDDDLFKADDYVPGVTTLAATVGLSGQKGWEVTTGAIVKYGLDKDGVVDSFEEMTDDYQLVADYSSAKTSSITEKGYYANEQIRDDAVIFSSDYELASISDDEDDYGVTTLDKILDTDDVNATYVLYKDKIAAMLLFDYSGTDETYGVVTEAKKTSGDSDYQATLFVDGKEVTYGLADSGVYNTARTHTDATEAAGTSSIFKLSFNASGEISDLDAAWTDGYYSPVKGDTYSTSEAILDTAEKVKSSSFSNNTFKVTSASITVKLDKDAVVYKNDDGDFKVANTSDLRTLNQGAHVYFYDTIDDSNDGLMNLVYIYNPDKETTTTPTTTTVGKITVYDAANDQIVAGGTAYTIVNTSTLYDTDGNEIAAGITDILAALEKGDTVKSVTLDSNGKVNKIVATSVDATAAIDAINAIAATSPSTGDARTAYDALDSAQEAWVTSATLKKLTDAEAVVADYAKVNIAYTNATYATQAAAHDAIVAEAESKIASGCTVTVTDGTYTPGTSLEFTVKVAKGGYSYTTGTKTLAIN